MIEVWAPEARTVEIVVGPPGESPERSSMVRDDRGWWRWDGEHKDGKCVDINALGWANAAISIALDAWMLVLPLWQVSLLKLAWKKKLSVALMFFVGTLYVSHLPLSLHSIKN